MEAGGREREEDGAIREGTDRARLAGRKRLRDRDWRDRGGERARMTGLRFQNR